MMDNLHSQFDSLSLWFEEVQVSICGSIKRIYSIFLAQDNPQTYTICTVFPNDFSLSHMPHPRIVTFTTATALDLPDPRYLRLHAAVCRVAQLSGTAQYLDSYDLELETMKVLAFDGSSSELLSSQLQRALLVVA